MARTYKRDARGRFSGGGGGSSGGSGGSKKAAGGGGAKAAYKRLSSERRRMNNSPAMQSADFAGERGANTRAMNRLVNTRGASATKVKGAGKPKAEPKAKPATGPKAPSTRAANNAVEKRMRATGQTAIGGRLMKSTAEKFSGTAATKRSRAAAMGADTRAGYGDSATWSRAKIRGTVSRKRGK